MSVVATQVWAPEPTLPTPEPTQVPEISKLNEAWADSLFALINQARVENGLNAVSRNQQLNLAANRYAEFLYKNYDMYNIDHGLDGLTPTERAQLYGYEGVTNEIISGGWISPEELFQRFMNSPLHKNEILSPLKSLGVGCYEGPYTFAASKQTITEVICVGNFGSI